MSQNDRTRTKVMIDAVVQAAAAGSPRAANPLKKLDAIAGLAGFVLRLFRSREPLPPGRGGPRDSARISEGSSNAVRRKVTPRAGAPELPAAPRKGGPRHG